MRRRGGDDSVDPFEVVELVDLDPPPAAEAGTAGDIEEWVARPSARTAVLRWWQHGRPLTRVLAVATVVLLAAAAVVGVAAGRSHPRTSTATEVITDPSVPAGADALGCPNGHLCGVRPVSGLLITIGIDGYENFPVISALETYDLASAAIYRREVIARVDRSVLRIVADCLPTRTGEVARFSYLDDNDAERVVAFALYRTVPGCFSFAYFAGPASPEIAQRLARSFAQDNRVVIQ